MHDTFKDTIFNVREYKTSSISLDDGYEVEAEYDDMKYSEKVDEINIQDLSKFNYMFNKAGCGITNDEAHLIGITMNQMSQLRKFKNIRYFHIFQIILVPFFRCKNLNEFIHDYRYWGKIIGLKKNYYILECDWKNKELEYKLKVSR